MIDKIFKGKEFYVIALGIIIFTGCNIAYDVFDVKGVWYIGNAFAFVCYAFSLYLLKKHFVTELLLFLTIGQLSDELIGNALSVHLFEYAIPLIFIIYKYHNFLRNGKSIK